MKENINTKYFKVMKQLIQPEIAWLREKKYRYVKALPTELQLPITYKCNFDCVMCGMSHMTSQGHISRTQLRNILSDQLFRNIRSVGINGGEPFLREDLIECIKSITEVLPKLEMINIISNGFFTKRIIELLPQIKALCEAKQIRVHLALSVDGINEMQNTMRGNDNAYASVMKTIHKIKKEKNKYCDKLTVICTITKYNIFRINEMKIWSEQNSISVSYNIATINRRIDNKDKEMNFSVFSDKETRFLTMEFLYEQYCKTKEEKYYGLYYFVKTGRRIASCPYRYYRGVTLMPNGQLAYCATHSKCLGDTTKRSAYDLFYTNQLYYHRLCKEKCSTCSQYIYNMNYEGQKELRSEYLRRIKFYLLKKVLRDICFPVRRMLDDYGRKVGVRK